jgi:hypothetical protein
MADGSLCTYSAFFVPFWKGNEAKWIEIYESDMGVSTNLEIRPKTDE